MDAQLWSKYINGKKTDYFGMLVLKVLGVVDFPYGFLSKDLCLNERIIFAGISPVSLG